MLCWRRLKQSAASMRTAVKPAKTSTPPLPIDVSSHVNGFDARPVLNSYSARFRVVVKPSRQATPARHCVDSENAVARFLEAARDRGLSEKTVEAYAWALGKLPAKLPTKPRELRRLLGRLDSLSKESRRDIVRVWRQFYRFTKTELAIPYPMDGVKAPPPERILHVPFTLDELKRLWSIGCCDDRDRALFALLIEAGPRLGEIANLQPADIQPDGTVIVTGKTGPRPIVVSALTLELLQRISSARVVWQNRKRPGKPLKSRGVQQMWKRIVARAGVRQTKENAIQPGIRRRRGLHAGRRSAASYLNAGGMPTSMLQTLLGHASITTTESYITQSMDAIAKRHRQATPLRLVTELEAVDR